MTLTWIRVAALALAFGYAAQVAAQLNGIYTCANGNPGNAFDYSDIGDFFTALENQGVNGPVTLDIYDDGGPFTSKASYYLGHRGGTSLVYGVAGVSLANPLVIRAAPGERPVITGAGAQGRLHADRGSMAIRDVGYLAIEGLTLRDAQNCGIMWIGDQDRSNIRISGCRIHGVTDGHAIWIGADLTDGPDAVIIENNMIWDCKALTPLHIVGGMVRGTPGIEWIIRHNTVVFMDAPDDARLFLFSSTNPVQEFHSNIAYMTSSATMWATRVLNFAPLPLFADRNIFFMQGAVTLWNGWWDFATWQAAGNDPNGMVADPLLVSLAPGLEDLHLQPNSPARDFSPIVSVQKDIDGETRPFGGLRDAGADEYLPPDFQLEFGAAVVPQGGPLNIGNVPLGGAQFNFTIRNTGPGLLKLTGVPRVALTAGANCDPATFVQNQPGMALLPPAAFTTFTVFIKATVPGALDLTLSIANNDAAKNPFAFAVNAIGLAAPPPNLPASAAPGAGSGFTGPVNGPFHLALNPGSALNNVVIMLTDPEANLVQVVSITALTAHPAGVIPPGVAFPLHPRPLTWIGSLNASNPPGNYTWRIMFRDGVNGSTIVSDVTIEILNPPPTHVAAGSTTGSGSQAAPYECAFVRGDDAAVQTTACNVSDVNAGQTPVITTVIRSPANPGGVDFAFSLNAGALSLGPAAMLTVAEAGFHLYEVKVSDGLNSVSIFVAMTVANPPVFFLTPAQLPGGESGTAYTQTLAVSGAMGAVTYTLTAGTLPDALALNAATGEISGMPTAATMGSFTIEATDATGATASRAFQLTITDPVQPPAPTPPVSNKGTGCVAGGGSALPLFVALALALRRKGARGKRQMEPLTAGTL